MDFLGIILAVSALSGNEIRINILNTPFVFYLPSLFGVGIRSPGKPKTNNIIIEKRFSESTKAISLNLYLFI